MPTGRADDERAVRHDDALAANLAWWERNVPVHVASDFYDVEGWLREARGPRRHEAELLGDVSGLDLVHLQCHFGKDTLSWARVGARVVGIDFSPEAIGAARHLAQRAGLDEVSEFYCAPVAEAADVLSGRRFDVVYVSLGSLCWLPRIDEWASVVARLLGSGGRLFIHDVHPLSQACDDNELTLAYSYFEEAEPYMDASEGTYADLEAAEPLPGIPTYEWNHSLGEVVNALISHGLRIDRLDEHDWTSFQRFPWLVGTGEEMFTVPDGQLRAPLSFTLQATRTS